MELLQQIKKDRLVARKAKDTVKAKLLTTLVGEAENILKGKQAKDYSTLALIKKFKDKLEETGEAKGSYTLEQSQELRILEMYIPKQYTMGEHIRIVEGLDLTKPLGQLMGQLKKEHGPRIDMGLARQIIQQETK